MALFSFRDYSYAKTSFPWQPIQAASVAAEKLLRYSPQLCTVVVTHAKYHPVHISTTMPAKPTDLFAFLDRLEIRYHTTRHEALFTVEQSRQRRGEISGGHSKNLFLKDKKGAFFLVVALEHAPIDLKTVQRVLGSARLSFASTEALREMLGVEPGAVTPFAAINDPNQKVSIILDAAMMEHATLNYHPLINTMTTSISREDLLKFLAATGHKAQVVAVSQ
jgi:Ala-tRNA(Pro) deacylase